MSQAPGQSSIRRARFRATISTTSRSSELVRPDCSPRSTPGLRGARTQVIDSLEEPGGALTAIYPEKYIYDVIGFPKVLAKDFVEQWTSRRCMTSRHPPQRRGPRPRSAAGRHHPAARPRRSARAGR